MDVETYRPDGIEIRSTNIKTEHQIRIRALAEQLAPPLLCNSDAHRAKDAGVYYNVLPHTPSTSPTNTARTGKPPSPNSTKQ